MERAYPLPQLTRVSEERPELPSGVRGGVLAKNKSGAL